MPESQQYNCPKCGHPWRLHDRYGCTQSNGYKTDGTFDDCECEMQIPAGHRD